MYIYIYSHCEAHKDDSSLCVSSITAVADASIDFFILDLDFGIFSFVVTIQQKLIY